MFTKAGKRLKEKSTITITLVVCGFWFLSKFLNVYRYAFLGAIYELLAFPMLLLIFIWPTYLIVRGLSDKTLNKPAQVLSLLICAATILFVILRD